VPNLVLPVLMYTRARKKTNMHGCGVIYLVVCGVMYVLAYHRCYVCLVCMFWPYIDVMYVLA
jgi:hypothetical protein